MVFGKIRYNKGIFIPTYFDEPIIENAIVNI